MIRLRNFQSLAKDASKALSFHTSSINRGFWEKEKKSGYSKRETIKFPNKKELIVEGFKELKSEIALWKEEVSEKLRMDPIVVYRPGEVDIVYDFQENKDIEKWVISADSDHNEGKSKANLQLTNAESALFHGFVDSEFLKDGKIKRTGYANMRTLRVKVKEIYFLLCSSKL